jgi:hypothetical protein
MCKIGFAVPFNEWVWKASRIRKAFANPAVNERFAYWPVQITGQ